MHASVHQLLNLRDEVIADSAVRGHVRECTKCSAELTRLRTLTSELRNLPARWEAPDQWAVIRERLKDPGARPAATATDAQDKHPGWRWPMAAAAAVVATVALLSWKGAGIDESAELVMHESPLRADAELEWRSLIAESRQLERILATLPDNRAVVRAGTALTLADLQDQIRWVDYRLARSEEAGLYPRQAEQLWRERVDLLNSLVAVRYAQARTPF